MLLITVSTADQSKTKASPFAAGSNWVKAFLKRKELISIRLHGEAGSVEISNLAEDISILKEKLADFEPKYIFNISATGWFYKLFPKISYILPSARKEEGRGTKGMKAKDRVPIYVWTNSTGTLKVPLSYIGKAKNPRYFRKSRPPLTYFSQKNAWSDTTTVKQWFSSLLLPFVRKKTSKCVTLIWTTVVHMVKIC